MDFNPFLRQVASYYSKFPIEELVSYRFVFPNHRSGYFFEAYFKEESRLNGRASLFPPKVTTMSGLVEQWCRLVEADETELLLLLYKTYVETILPEIKEKGSVAPALEHDRFFFWGDVVLNDYNEIDKSLADADHLFRNLKNIKEIQSTYLTEPDMELIKQFWKTTGILWLNEEDERKRMWTHLSGNDGNEGLTNFLKLWEVLGPLYNAFKESLLKKGLCYIGMAYRKSVEELRSFLENDEQFNRYTYVFIGFSNLSKAEKKIMELLKKYDRAIFHWDTNLPLIGDHKFPLRLINEYIKSFPDKSDLVIAPVDYSPEIKIYSVPSEIGQVKLVADILSERPLEGEEQALTDKPKELNVSNALNYAVVLPEVEMTVPLMNLLELPAGVDVNITLGYPLRSTSIATLMRCISEMKSRCEEQEGIQYFLKNDVIEVLSHPLLIRNCFDECKQLLDYLSKKKKLVVSSTDLSTVGGSLSFLFLPVVKTDVESVLGNLNEIAKKFIDIFETSITEKENNSNSSLEIDFLNAYLYKIQFLTSLIKKYQLFEYLSGTDNAIVITIDKMMRRMSLNFVGTPLKGIQVMGILETRSLDFSTLIMTSMNERIFPRKLQKPTFIPQILRNAYGLDNRDDEETTMAYHFYRLLGRVKKAHFIYNNDTEGMKSGEMSRYLYQLKYLYRYDNIEEFNVKYQAGQFLPTLIKIDKTPQMMEKINLYRGDCKNGKGRTLSASSIKKLLTCPLEFYLSEIAGYKEIYEEGDHIDDSMFGTIVHEVMRTVYIQYWENENKSGKPSIRINDIDKILKSDLIESLAKNAIYKEYIKSVEETEPEPLEGEKYIFKKMTEAAVRSILEAEKNYMETNDIDYFVFEHAEIPKVIKLKLSENLTINFKYIIDRVDRVHFTDPSKKSTLRIIDYKTGGDPLEFREIDELTNYEGSKSPKAITQLMLYANAYVCDPENGVDGSEPIHPMIFKLKDIVKNGGIRDIRYNKIKKEESDDREEQKPADKRVRSNKDILKDYRAINPIFLENMTSKIEDLFNPNVSFEQAKSDDACGYCQFKEICGRH